MISSMHIIGIYWLSMINHNASRTLQQTTSTTCAAAGEITGSGWDLPLLPAPQGAPGGYGTRRLSQLRTGSVAAGVHLVDLGDADKPRMATRTEQ